MVFGVIIHYFKLFCPPLHVKLAVYVSDLVPEVVIGDPGRFRQIITHLVGNSLKVRFYQQLLTNVSICMPQRWMTATSYLR